jgi:hypothetical protein
VIDDDLVRKEELYSAFVTSERRSRFPFTVVCCPPAFAEAVRRPLRPRLRIRFPKPMASRR